jgi:hypothetical protein
MPEELSDQKEVASVIGDATSTNLGGSIDRGVKETQQHEYWRASTNIEAHVWILKEIGRL